MKSILKIKRLLQNKIPYPASLRPLHDQINENPKKPLNASTTETLEDLHGRKHDYLRISLTERCNLRCQYCMPAEGVTLSPKPALLSRAELLRLARLFAALGVNKVRLTGGEPTLRADIVDIVQELSSLPGIRTVAMTSNGLALTRRLPALQRAGLSALNLSLDTLRPDRFETMTRRPGLPRVLASIDLALQLGYSPVKVNTVLMKGFNDDEICDFADFTKDRDVEVRNEKRRHFSCEQPTDDTYRRVGWSAARARAPGGVSRRAYSTGGDGARLTHLDEEGRARMVDVGGKAETTRTAEAECYVEVSEEVVRLLRAGGGPKGDAVAVAELAGVMAAKRTADLIPLCHALPLASVRVRVTLPQGAGGGAVRVWCVARARACTGVEMEALTGCAMAALALYDMCKAADRHMRVSGLRVLSKSGGASDWTAPEETGADG